MPEVVDPPAAAPAAAAPAAATPAAAPAAASPAPEPPKGGAAPADPPATPPADPPAAKSLDNWRDLAVGTLPDDASPEQKEEHDKLTKLVKRFNTLPDAVKALREAQRKISSGELKAPLPKNATPEQVAEWRRENGIPEKPEDYKIELPKGAVLGDADKPIVDGFVKAMHEKNTPPDVVNAAVAWYVQSQEERLQAMAESDKAYRAAMEDTLREEWGSDFRANKDGVEAMVGQWPEEVRKALLTARTGEGFLIEHPGVMRALADQARQLGFVGATVVPKGGDLGASVDQEIAAIEKSMFNEDGTKNSAYWKSDKAQARYAQLLETRGRLAK